MSAVRADGRKIRRIQEQKGLTGSRLAKEAGITHATLSRIVTGQQGATLKTLEKIAGVLEVDPGELQRGLEPDWLTALADIVRARTQRIVEATAEGTISVDEIKSAEDLGKDVSGYVNERAGSVEGQGSVRIEEALEDLQHAVNEGRDPAVRRLFGWEKADISVFPEKRRGGSKERMKNSA